MDRLKAAVFSGDVDLLNEIAPCHCCCEEHNMGRSCPAWAWGGCRGYRSDGLTNQEDEAAWVRHYARYHGMTEEQFYYGR